MEGIPLILGSWELGQHRNCYPISSIIRRMDDTNFPMLSRSGEDIVKEAKLSLLLGFPVS